LLGFGALGESPRPLAHAHRKDRSASARGAVLLSLQLLVKPVRGVAFAP
jgi:hypothetical protein